MTFPRRPVDVSQVARGEASVEDLDFGSNDDSGIDPAVDTETWQIPAGGRQMVRSGGDEDVAGSRHAIGAPLGRAAEQGVKKSQLSVIITRYRIPAGGGNEIRARRGILVDAADSCGSSTMSVPAASGPNTETIQGDEDGHRPESHGQLVP